MALHQRQVERTPHPSLRRALTRAPGRAFRVLRGPHTAQPDEARYWRRIWRAARQVGERLRSADWCNGWHTHFDWAGRGAASRFSHRQHLRPLLYALNLAQRVMAERALPSQVFALVHPNEPAQDALYVHTPNPHSEFPMALAGAATEALPPLLMGLVSRARYRLSVCHGEAGASYIISPRSAASIARATGATNSQEKESSSAA